MSVFTEANWNHCQYTNQDKKVIVSLGASPDCIENDFIYFVTLLDNDHNEIIQEEFRSLSLACEHINKKFSQTWEFTDLSSSLDSDSGCSSCVAH